MNKSDALLAVLSTSVKMGAGVHTVAELAFMLDETPRPAFTKFLADCVKKGILRRVAHGVYESVITPPDPKTALYKIARKLREGHLTYISLESQLSHTGLISQVTMGHLTVMTKGRSGVFQTPYGVIELTHTKQSVRQLAPHLYLDQEVKMYRADSSQALADLRRVGRNLQMLEV